MKHIKHIQQSLVFFLFSLFVFTSCDKNNVTPIQLIASPDSLIIFDTDTVRELVISTRVTGEASYVVTHKPDWVEIELMKGRINKKLEVLRIKPQVQDMTEGIYRDYISIISDIAGKVDIPISLSVKSRPILALNLMELNFDEKTSQLTFYIENKGKGILNWSIENLPKWLNISQYDLSGYNYPNEKHSFIISCNRENLDIGVLKSNFTIKSNCLKETVQIPVTLYVPSSLKLKFAGDNLFFDYNETEKEIFIKNSGNVGFNWNSTYENIFTMHPASGYLNKGDSVKVKISLINRTVFETGTYTKPIYVYNDSFRDTLNVSINNFIDTKWILDRNIADAKFCSSTNKIIIISSNPYQLSVIDPEAKTINSVNLNYAPQCVSVEKNGNYAAVGHNGRISLIDLSKMNVINEYKTAYNIEQVIVTSTNWIYFSYFSNFFGINTITGTSVSKYTSMYSNGPIVLHPSEKYIFSYSLGTTGNIYKISIADGIIKELYNKSYSMNFWIANDGTRMYKTDWDVLSLSDNQSNDMVYVTNFNDLPNNHITSISDNQNKNKICLITGINPYYLRVYDYKYFRFQKSYSLESFIVNNSLTGTKLYHGEGKYVFLNNGGDKAYVLLKVNSGSGLYHEWALQNISIE